MAVKVSSYPSPPRGSGCIFYAKERLISFAMSTVGLSHVHPSNRSLRNLTVDSSEGRGILLSSERYNPCPSPLSWKPTLWPPSLSLFRNKKDPETREQGIDGDIKARMEIPTELSRPPFEPHQRSYPQSQFRVPANTNSVIPEVFPFFPYFSSICQIFLYL